MQDIEAPLPDPSQLNTTTKLATYLVQWLCFFLLYWQLICHISDNGLEWLLQFLLHFLQVINSNVDSIFLREILFILPTSVYLLRKSICLDRDHFTKYVVCPRCCKLYSFEECLRHNNAGNVAAKRCTGNIWGKPCGSQIVKEVILSNGTKHFYPIKTYCYQSIINQLEVHLKRPNFAEMCEQWRGREKQEGVYCDIYDGDIWNNFQWSDNQLFFTHERHYGLMLNVDWFQPFKHRTDYSVGVIYFVIMNLPRSERFKFENVMIAGIIPAMDKEPKLNTFLEPVVTELKCLWRGIKLLSNMTPVPITFVAALLCVASDVPATRKLCGFKSHAANLGCSKCKKSFSGGIGNKDYSGFNRQSWTPRTKSSHNRYSTMLKNCRTQREHDAISKEHGTYYSILTELDYFDAVKFHIIDPMHNLFLGVAKRIWKVWMDDVLSKAQLTEINQKIQRLNIATDIGRIGSNISSNYGAFTAQEWKNWTITHSMYVLHGIIPKQHLLLWERFVLASRILCKRIITKEDVLKADTLLLAFCKSYEKLYGKQSITPNLHLCCHLKDCIFNFGPIYSFWCFSFERYNGEIVATVTNNRSVEIQYMRKFVTFSFVNPLNGNVPIHYKDEFQHIFGCSMAKNDFTISVLPNIINLFSIPITASTQNVKWDELSHINHPSEFTESAFDKDDLLLLLKVYKVMYPETMIMKEHLSFIYKQFKVISIGEERFGSMKESRSLRSARIMASWTGERGNIDLASKPRPGEVKFYFEHSVHINGNSTVHLFANVKWYGQYPSSTGITSLNLWKADDYECGGESAFIPVQRIYCRVAAGFLQKGSTKCLIPCPLPRKLCG